jgi:hypothetical protein
MGAVFGVPVEKKKKKKKYYTWIFGMYQIQQYMTDHYRTRGRALERKGDNVKP